MSFKIGDVRFDLGAGTATLGRDLAAARTMVNKYVKDAQKSFAAGRQSLNKYGPAIVGAASAGAAAFAALQKQSIDFARNIVTSADRIHVTTAAFQELSYAADKYQISQDALVDGLKELQLRSDEFARDGAGSAADAFARLGYEQADVQDGLKDTDKFFQDIIRRMEGLDSAAQIRIADEIFGGQGGEQFVALIADGADNLAKMRQEAHKLGLVIEDDLLRQAEETGRQLDLLGKVVGVNLSRAMLKLGPLIQAVSEELRDSLIGGIDGAEGKTKDFTTTVVNGFRTSAEVLGVFLDGLRGIHVILKGAEIAFEGLRGVAGLLFQGLNELMRGFQYDWNILIAEPVRDLGLALGKDWDFTVELNAPSDFDTVLAESTARIEQAKTEMLDLLSQELPSEGLKRSVQNIIDRMGELQEQAKKTGEAVDQTAGGQGGQGGGTAKLDAHAEAMQSYVQQLKAAQVEADLFFEKQTLLDQMFAQGKISAEAYNAELDRMADSLTGISSEGTDAFDDLKTAITGWGSNFSSELNDMLWEADTTFADILKSFTKMLTQMIIQKAVVDPLLQSALGSSTTTANAHGNIFTGGRVTPFAKGGVVSRPTLFPMSSGTGLMGEAGPEAIMPLKRLPGGDLGVRADLGGGGGANVTIINQTGVQADADVRRNGDGNIEVLLTRAVAGNINRGGEIGKAMESTYGLRRQGVRR